MNLAGSAKMVPSGPIRLRQLSSLLSQTTCTLVSRVVKPDGDEPSCLPICIMLSDEDDYLSNKFLDDEQASSSKPTTYSQLRKAAQKKAQSKNEQNRLKSRRRREIESREEGLSKSLFERAKEEEASMNSGNKALSIMMKMGFKPGQSLGNNDNDISSSSPPKNDAEDEPQKIGLTSTLPDMSIIHTKHKTEPLPLKEWEGQSTFFIALHLFIFASIILGRKGIGLGKRPRSPSAAERLVKIAKMAEEMDHRDFRKRARDDYNNRRAEGRLGVYSSRFHLHPIL